jgi:dihydroorotase
MSEKPSATLLKNAHVIDPSQDLDGRADVLIADGKIAAIGDLPPTPDATVVYLDGQYVSPGWIDVHVHAYGTLGFANADSIGIDQGVTTYVDAGGASIDSLDEFLAVMPEDMKTSLFVGAFIRPIGIIGLSYIEDEIRSLDSIPLGRWLDFVEEHPGLIRYLKMGAFNEWGGGPLRLGKGLAEILGVPLYIHIGEFRTETNRVGSLHAFEAAGRGDIITHLYHANAGSILDEAGKVLPSVRDAERRGVLFDIGFGGNNFAWNVAEAGFAQGIAPHLISSDLQQYNVTGPAYSLANVMSIFHRLGMSVQDVIKRVTTNPASALSFTDRGSLRVGMPADVTAFRIESGEFEFMDCVADRRIGNSRFVPTMAYKAGVRFDSDLSRCQDERNWLMSVSSEIPEAVRHFSPVQKAFLGSFAAGLSQVEWDTAGQERLSLAKAAHIKTIFQTARQQHGLTMRDALCSVYDSFLEQRFSIQIGLFIMRLERDFALERLNSVAELRSMAA